MAGRFAVGFPAKFEGMNAGGTPFWLALTLSVVLAGVATWSFLGSGTVAPGSPVHAGAGPVDGVPPESSDDAEGVAPTESNAESEPVEADAPDVTFSFAVEVARFEDGTRLEQDDLHRVTCRGVDGEIRWELGMEDTLLGAHQLDANGDGTIEILLVDRAHAVGLDAGGRPIPGFSIRPGVDITSHAVVDYDGDGNERYLLGLADGRILNHRRLGEATPGWRHESKGRPIQAIAHLRAGRKDYLCSVDEKGVVMLLKRSGQRRVRTPSQLHAVAGRRPVAFQVKSDIGSSLLIARDAEGVAQTRRFDDGIPRPASQAEVQLLEAVEARWSRVDVE